METATSSDLRKRIVGEAKAYMGTKYKKYDRGKAQDSALGLNCYGLFDAVLRKSGITPDNSTPLHIWALWAQLPDTETPEPGDLVFQDGPKGKRAVHVGIFNGETAIHASREHGSVVETPVEHFNPIKGYKSIRRYLKD